MSHADKTSACKNLMLSVITVLQEIRNLMQQKMENKTINWNDLVLLYDTQCMKAQAHLAKCTF